jgi:hypothetical protein
MKGMTTNPDSSLCSTHNVAFWAFVQGDLNLNNYCRKMKGMTDALCDLGEPVPDRIVILNILQGLNQWYNHLKTFL